MNEHKGPAGSGADSTPHPDLGAEASEHARATLDHAREDARALVDRARESAISALDRQKAEAANQLEGLAQAFRCAADALDKQAQGPVARYAGVAAESLGGMAEALNEQDLQTLLSNTRKLARRQPALFIGGAVALGFGVARFFKGPGELSLADPARAEKPFEETFESPAPRRAEGGSGAAGATRAKPRGRSRSRSGTGRGSAG